MAGTESSDPGKHVAVLAFPFGSHPMPLLNLVRKLAHAAPNVRFSFFSTAKSNHSLFSAAKVDESFPHNVKSYNVEDGMPAGHVLSGHPVEAVDLFLNVSTENFKRGVDVAVAENGKRITCLLSDAFLTSAGDVAEYFHVAWVPVWVSFPCSLSAHIHTDLIRKRCAINGTKVGAGSRDGNETLEFVPGLSSMRVSDLPEEVVSGRDDESLFSLTLSQVGLVLPRVTALAIGFCKELNPPLLNHDLEKRCRKVLNVGFLTLPLPPPPLPPSDSDLTGCLSWLDERKARSVAYVSFGTVASPPREELLATAEALEASGIPFLWSLKDNIKELLPREFLEKTSSQGKIVPWTNQTQVLAHTSIGVFVTHCGCNSVYESIAYGVPMICRPFFGDQRMTGRMVEEVWRIGLLAEGGILNKNGLLNSLELILEHGRGEEMRKKAHELKDLVHNAASPNGSATRDLIDLVDLISTS
nr:flavonol 3-O-galactosyltransferase [Morella rubra]